MEKISIVIPMYNAKRTLKKTLDSILKQTYKNFEVILVDDGSTDGSAKVCDAYAQKDSRIKVFHKENEGLFLTRRFGIDKCENKGYICFSDADDIMPETALEDMMNEIGDSDMLIADFKMIFRSIKYPKTHRDYMDLKGPLTLERKDFLENYFSNWFGISDLPICLWSKLYKAELIKKASDITPTIVHFLAEDLIVTMNAVFIAEKVTILPKPVYYYRPCGNTNRYMPTFLEDWSALYKYRCEFIEDNDLPTSYRRTLDIEYGHMMIEYFLNLKRSKRFTDDEIKERIKFVLESDELKTALSNEQIDFEIYIYLKLLKNGDVEKIFDEVNGRIKKNAFLSYIKNILRKFS